MLPGRSFHASWKFMEVTFVSKKKRKVYNLKYLIFGLDVDLC
jgi:hypothetical protein